MTPNQNTEVTTTQLLHDQERVDGIADDFEDGEDDVEAGVATGGLWEYPRLNTTNRICIADAKKKKKKKKPKKKKLEQSDPPRVGLSKFYPDGIYPEGEIQEYKDE